MTEDRCSRLDPGRLLNASCHAGRMTDAFRIDNDMMLLAALSARYDVIDQLLLILIIFFRKQDILAPFAIPHHSAM